MFTDAQKSAVEVLNHSRKSTVEDPDACLYTVFSNTEDSSENPYIEKEIPAESISTPLYVKSQVKTFIIWRPWTSCERCKQLLEDEPHRLPQMSGDHVCPHVQISEFLEIKNKCLRGNGLIQKEEYSSLKDGTQIVLIVWLTMFKENSINPYGKLSITVDRIE